MNTDTRQELADYLAGVRAALADLPADELSELMEDVEPHVTEVFGEPGSPVERLGTPEAYAAELRAAGGYPAEPARTAAPRRLAGRFVLWVVAVVTVLAGMAAMACVRDHTVTPLGVMALFLPPYLLALWLVLSKRVGRADITGLPEYLALRRLGQRAVGLLPGGLADRLRSAAPVWPVVSMLVLALAALALLDRTPELVFVLVIVAGVLLFSGNVVPDRRKLPLTLPAGAAVVGCALALAALAVSRDGGSPYYPVYSTYGLTYNGNRLSNVYAVGADGKPIDVFYLYDSKGVPITVYSPSCDERVGREDRNRFPLPMVSYKNGLCVEETGLPFVPLVPGVSTSLTPSVSSAPAPSSSLSPAPSTSPTPATPTK